MPNSLAPPRPRRGRLSRPARIQDLEAAARELAAEYQGWCDALPENQADGEMANHLAETVEQLEEIADALADIEPPVIGAPR
jgi:hypothetical protein